MTQFTNCLSAWRPVGDLHQEGDCSVVTVLHLGQVSSDNP